MQSTRLRVSNSSSELLYAINTSGGTRTFFGLPDIGGELCVPMRENEQTKKLIPGYMGRVVVKRTMAREGFKGSDRYPHILKACCRSLFQHV